jgi:hypothetical protein
MSAYGSAVIESGSASSIVFNGLVNPTGSGVLDAFGIVGDWVPPLNTSSPNGINLAGGSAYYKNGNTAYLIDFNVGQPTPFTMELNPSINLTLNPIPGVSP